MMFFWTFYSSRNPGKKWSQFPQKHEAVFNINNNQKCFLVIISS